MDAKSRRSWVLIGIAVTGLAATILLTLALMSVHARIDAFKAGSIEGFSLRGTYQAVTEPREDGAIEYELGIKQATFETDGELVWQIQELGGLCDGTFEETSDPNAFVMYDEAGERVGSVRILYEFPGNDAMIRVDMQEGSVVLSRTTDATVFQVP